MRKFARAAAAGAMLAALGGAGLVTASPASAAASYSLIVDNQAGFVADFCLHSQNYDNHDDHHAVCSGDRALGDRVRLSVPVTNRHRVWLDVWVRGGRSGTQITVHNGFNERANKHVFDTRWCVVLGTTFNWELNCDAVQYYKQ
jgi:hypothetical protein